MLKTEKALMTAVAASAVQTSTGVTEKDRPPQRQSMDDSPPSGGGRSVILNHNGLEEEEDHDPLEESSEVSYFKLFRC
ncbi:hypothetical protein ANCCAN_13038 [Ancylostoma caninum]|uniref:Uncharacterized protein n=1 Tax=Ancylostoma caninum TaxID=29170 RepID=A0A368G9G5_ANCCA|nr:hypothetical protein ANCCAN_13038 [Ancylostoma caninum]